MRFFIYVAAVFIVYACQAMDSARNAHLIAFSQEDWNRIRATSAVIQALESLYDSTVDDVDWLLTHKEHRVFKKWLSCKPNTQHEAIHKLPLEEQMLLLSVADKLAMTPLIDAVLPYARASLCKLIDTMMTQKTDSFHAAIDDACLSNPVLKQMIVDKLVENWPDASQTLFASQQAYFKRINTSSPVVCCDVSDQDDPIVAWIQDNSLVHCKLSANVRTQVAFDQTVDAMRLSADGRQAFLFSSESQQLLVVDLSSGAIVEIVQTSVIGRVNFFGLSPSGRFVLLNNQNNVIHIVDLEDMKMHKSVRMHELITAAAWSKAEDRIALGCSNGDCFYIDFRNKQWCLKSCGVKTAPWAITYISFCDNDSVIEYMNIKGTRHRYSIHLQSMNKTLSSNQQLGYSVGDREMCVVKRYDTETVFVYGTRNQMKLGTIGLHQLRKKSKNNISVFDLGILCLTKKYVYAKIDGSGIVYADISLFRQLQQALLSLSMDHYICIKRLLCKDTKANYKNGPEKEFFNSLDPHLQKIMNKIVKTKK